MAAYDDRAVDERMEDMGCMAGMMMVGILHALYLIQYGYRPPSRSVPIFLLNDTISKSFSLLMSLNQSLRTLIFLFLGHMPLKLSVIYLISHFHCQESSNWDVSASNPFPSFPFRK